MRLRGPEPLQKRHDIDNFACGVVELDTWLNKHARTAEGSGSARVFVIVDEDVDPERVVGFYALAAGEVVKADAPAKVAAQMPAGAPVVVLGRLAVDSEYGRQGVGDALLKDAMLRALNAADNVGIAAMIIHAQNEVARDWYERRGFQKSPVEELKFHMWYRMKDMKRALADAQAAAAHERHSS